MSNRLITINNEIYVGVDLANQMLTEIFECDWLENVGKKSLKNVVRCNSWQDAIALANDPSDVTFSDFLTTMSNELRSIAAKTDRDKYNKYWGKATSEVRKSLTPFLKKSVFPKIPNDGAKDSPLGSSIAGALTNPLCLALLYDKRYEPSDTFIKYYLNGYLPCGYVGKYPNGKIVVY